MKLEIFILFIGLFFIFMFSSILNFESNLLNLYIIDLFYYLLKVYMIYLLFSCIFLILYFSIILKITK